MLRSDARWLSLSRSVALVTTIGMALAVPLLALAAPALQRGKAAPNFKLTTLDGKAYQLQAYRGKSVVVLDFGRLTCLPCRSVVSDLQKLQRKYRGKGVQIFSVNLDGSLACRVIPRGVQEFGLTFPILVDKDYKVAEAYGCETIPYLVLVDSKGIVRWAHVGYETDLVTRLSQLIDKYRPKTK